MKDTFYIYFNRDNTWEVRLIKNHFTMANANSKEEIFKKLVMLVHRYKTPNLLWKAYNNMSEKPKFSRETIKRREKDYLEARIMYENETLKVISEALKEVVYDTPVKKTSNGKIKILKVAKEAVLEIEPPEIEEPEEPELKVKVKKINKVKRLKI